ncbi:MAG: hypothetical protein AB7U98_08275 [Candidatus Nitrosocosmicus sp.]
MEENQLLLEETIREWKKENLEKEISSSIDGRKGISITIVLKDKNGRNLLILSIKY